MLVDPTTRRVLVANDRFSICPVHYRQSGERLLLASCLNALAGSGARPALSPQAIYDYVFFHCIPSPRTIYRDIAKLEPAASLSWNAAGVVSETYWRPDFAAAQPAGDAAIQDRCKARVEELTERARLREDVRTHVVQASRHRPTMKAGNRRNGR